MTMASHVNVAIASHFDDGEVHGIPREEGIQVQASQLGNIDIHKEPADKVFVIQFFL